MQEFPRIVVPQPVMAYSTSRVLTMDYIQGRKITAIGPLRKMEMDGSALAEELFRAYLKQILVDGIFHADPHPGNVFITDDNRVALLDLGMVGHVLRHAGASAETADRAQRRARRRGGRHRGQNRAIRWRISMSRSFRRRIVDLVTQQQDAQVKDINVGRVMLDFAHIASESAIRMPAELTMLSKTLLNLDDIGAALDPEFNPNASIPPPCGRDHAAADAEKHLAGQSGQHGAGSAGVCARDAGTGESHSGHGSEKSRSSSKSMLSTKRP